MTSFMNTPFIAYLQIFIKLMIENKFINLKKMFSQIV